MKGGGLKGGTIRIRGARQNNLAGVDVDLPQGALVAITGVSGSGKSSLAFDTLFREGQRRFLETLSAYARQFLGGLSKPDVESIEGLSPAIAVDQKTVARGSRSTVGTVTEIVDHLRVLFARAGEAHCPACDLPIRSRTPEAVVQEILRDLEGERVQLLAPLIRDRKGHHRPLFEDLRKKGFVRVRVDGVVSRLEEVVELERYKRHTIEVVVDRLKPVAGEPARLREAIEQALDLGKGDVIVLAEDGERAFSIARTCPGCGADTPPLEPRLFSFNSPHGACKSCQGLGEQRAPSEASIVRDPKLSIRAGALAVTRADGKGLSFPRVDFDYLERVGDAAGFDLDTPWKSLSAKARRAVLHGTGEERFEDHASWSGKRSQGEVNWMRRYKGVVPALAEAKGIHKNQAERFLVTATCEACGGSRLGPAARAVRLGNMHFPELTRLPVGELGAVLAALELSARQQRIAHDLLNEIARRVEFLEQVGLAYLTLDRGADSLSGGESQRIRLAAQLGAGLQGVLYVLDEPSIGLHARDHGRLLDALGKLRDMGNSVIVVEHDEATLRAADWLVDVGPGAGRHGGRIVASGPPDEVASAETPTGRLLRGEIRLPAPSERRKGRSEILRVRGARAFNLKDIDVDFPLGTLTVVTGVSGSGKSTLIDRTLSRAVLRHLERETDLPGEHASIEGLDHVDDLVAIDADPIGRTPRSNPATYTKVFDPIRDLFAMLPEARARGYTKSRFSFNVAGGRCEACQGAGARYVELQFLAPVTVPCEECGGHRFQAETLDVRYQGHSIADVLALEAEAALELFRDHPRIHKPLALMVEIGLGYLTLGQPSTTLSGGEAQRLKLVTHLAKNARGHVLYLLDEPTTGLHLEDVGRLVGALQRLVDHGHTVLVVEHNLELVRAADHVIDLGPDAGQEGGRVVVTGTPEVVARHRTSYTGKALRDLESARGKHAHAGRIARTSEAPRELRVFGARTHNLKGVDVSIPRGSLTVVTGPSGSGKSSLALDTIHTEGRRRFVESLSTYARQFLGTRERPPFERMEGLGPSIAVEARTSGSHPRSTIATTTEIHDHVRVLWARAGTPHCPEHGTPLEQHDPAGVARRCVKALEGQRGWIVAPIVGHGRKSESSRSLVSLVPGWKSAGYLRLLVDGEEVRIDADLPDLAAAESVDVVIDRLAFDSASRARIAEAVENAASLAHGRASAVVKATGSRRGERLEFSTLGACTQCGFQLESELEPRHFSFNTHVGACPTCEGLGSLVRCAPELLVTDPSLPLAEGAVGGKLGRYLTKGKGYYEMLLRAVAKAHGIDLERPYQQLARPHKELLLTGKGARESYTVELERATQNAEVHERFTSSWTGLCGHVDAWHEKTDDAGWAAILETVMRRQTCPDCEGERLAKAYRFVTVGALRPAQFLRQSVVDALAWLAGLELPARSREAIAPVLEELRSRLALLERVGLGYLTLDRATATLSGGEARRVRLSASLGSHLSGVCYVLDEPTVGLHPRDVERLAQALRELCERGNTVLVVEHDEAMVRRADWIVDMGPGAGSEGGRLVASGPLEQVIEHPESRTAAWLRGELALEKLLAEERAEALPPNLPEPIVMRGATGHNLRGVDLEVRFGELLGLCGPSGSGKSTLVLDTLVPALRQEASEGRWSSLSAPLGGALRVVVVDASPIGRSPHSVPATYTGVMKPLRELFARTPEARVRGFDASRFSFNSTTGRCPACEGRGAILVEMQFLADLWLTCEECEGRRFLPEVLEVRLRGRSIADVLDMTVDEARAFLEHQPEIIRVLDSLAAVGLGYLRLGQSSTTLSGGEAQRVKLAGELVGAEETSRAVLVLDEPSTGLSASDTVHLARVLLRLARRGNAVVLIEHHTELLALCDRLVELGPEGGEGGGRVITVGTPKELAADPSSVTGPWLFDGKGFSSGAPGTRQRSRRKARMEVN
jgi:excinuclease ABC subunit A